MRRRRHVIIPALVVCLVAASQSPAAAQVPPGSVHLSGGLVWPRQDGAADGESQTYVTSPGGTTLGWTIGGGVLIARFASLDVEVNSTGVMKAREPSRYFMTFNEERRDRFITAAVRFHVGLWRAVALEPLCGIAVVRTERWSQAEYLRPWLPPGQQTEVGPRVHETLPARTGVTMGVDARLGGRHLAVVPSFRAHYVPEPDDLSSTYPAGFARWTLQLGIALRIDF